MPALSECILQYLPAGRGIFFAPPLGLDWSDAKKKKNYKQSLDKQTRGPIIRGQGCSHDAIFIREGMPPRKGTREDNGRLSIAVPF